MVAARCEIMVMTDSLWLTCGLLGRFARIDADREDAVVLSERQVDLRHRRGQVRELQIAELRAVDVVERQNHRPLAIEVRA